MQPIYHKKRNKLTNNAYEMRRFARLANAFSKKVETLEHAVSLHFMYYNFVRQHQTLRVSPAMEAGVTDGLCSMEDIVKLIEEKGGKKSN